MKKIVNITVIFLVLFLSIFSIHSYAATLEEIDVSTDKQIVHPGEEIKININFGESLGAYTFDIAYDNQLLEYVSAEGGTANDNGTRVRILFYDETGGSSPRDNLTLTFRAKDGITTSNPTDFSVTAEGLGSADSSTDYEDITIPIKKNFIVEPKYEEYKINLKYEGEILENEEKEMSISVSSEMGKNYEHSRIIAEATGPEGGNVKLFAIDSEELEHDIIQNGWGEIQGDPIGGQNVLKELSVTGIFSKEGNYEITLKLIDRDNSDEEITSETFAIEVKSKEGNDTVEEDTEKPNNEVSQDIPDVNVEGNVGEDNTMIKEESNQQEEMPEALPKTGNTIYFSILTLLGIFIVGFIIYKNKNKN